MVLQLLAHQVVVEPAQHQVAHLHQVHQVESVQAVEPVQRQAVHQVVLT